MMYLALEGAWLWVALRLMYRGWTWDDPTATYADQAAKVAEESKLREAVLSKQHPYAAFQLGVEYGYLGELSRGIQNAGGSSEGSGAWASEDARPRANSWSWGR